jgi:hypothetical protein
MKQLTNVVQDLMVYQTSDYGQFKILFGNRNTNELHVKRLIQSFKTRYLFSPILVNEKMQIIDGQHRFLACKELSLPINYIVARGYGLEEVQILNTNNSNWTKHDYLKAYCDLGVKTYGELKQFMIDFPDFSIGTCIYLITNSAGDVKKQTTIDKLVVRMKDFEEGKLVIPDLALSYKNANKIMLLKGLYEGYNRGVFVRALIGIFKNPAYKHDNFISRVKKTPTMLSDCATVMTYKGLIEEIYNYRRSDKINLRFY